MSYQHWPPQKPSAAGSPGPGNAPFVDENSVPVTVTGGPPGGVQVTLSSKDAKNVVVGVPPVDRLTANLATAVNPLVVWLPWRLVWFQVGVAAHALLVTQIPPSFGVAKPKTFTSTVPGAPGSNTMSVTERFPPLPVKIDNFVNVGEPTTPGELNTLFEA